MSRKAKRMYGTHESTDKIIDGVVYRTCRFCGQTKPLHEFSRNGYNDDGSPAYRHDCKVCYNVRRRENKAKKSHSDFIGSMKRRGEPNVAYTHQEWKETVIFFGGECCYCGRTMRKGERLTRDHLEPVSVGGRSTQDNIVPACSSCNSSKGASEWREWYMKQPFFSQERMNKIFRWRNIIRQLAEGTSHES